MVTLGRAIQRLAQEYAPHTPSLDGRSSNPPPIAPVVLSYVANPLMAVSSRASPHSGPDRPPTPSKRPVHMLPGRPHSTLLRKGHRTPAPAVGQPFTVGRGRSSTSRQSPCCHTSESFMLVVTRGHGWPLRVRGFLRQVLTQVEHRQTNRVVGIVPVLAGGHIQISRAILCGYGNCLECEMLWRHIVPPATKMPSVTASYLVDRD